MNCYKEFAYIYDELINNDIDYKNWGELILKFCKDKNISMEAYLDLACGTGNFTEVIGKSFKQVWGVDLSEDMLWEADKKLRKCGIKAKLICQDICDLDLNKKFDLITCCLDSTNYILKDEDLKSYFKGVSEHLKDGGIFIFDINSYYKLSEILGNNVFNYDNEEVTYIWENEFANEIVDMYLTFFVKRGTLYERFNEEHSERAYTEETIERTLKEAGLTVVKKLDNYNSEILSDDTERIAYIVEKL